MAKLYLLNSPILTDYGLWRFTGPVTRARARRMAAGGFISAIGHESTARLLQQVLGMPVAAARICARIEPGDRALVFRLKARPPEGAVLDEAALQALDWELSLLERLE